MCIHSPAASINSSNKYGTNKSKECLYSGLESFPCRGNSFWSVYFMARIDYDASPSNRPNTRLILNLIYRHIGSSLKYKK